MAETYETSVPTADRQKLSLRGWEVADPRAVLVVTPGFADHAGRYSQFGQDLGARGYSTYVYDPRGHGRSTGPRGHTPSWSALVADQERVVAFLESQGKLKARAGFLGSSMGALIALEWALANPARVRGLVLAGAVFELAFTPPPAKELLARLAGALLPRLSQATGMRGSQMSHDPIAVEAYDTDPLIHHVMSSRYYLEFRAAQLRLAGTAAQVAFPVLVLHGGADPVGRPEAAARWAAAVPRPWAEWKVYPGLKHEILNELVRVRVVNDIAGWLDRKVPDHLQIGP